MPNFEAQVRTTYRDVAGLVLSCDRADVIEDPNNPGFVREWINRAPGLPSIPAIRNPGAPAPTYLGGRFSNPKQTVQALQPTLALTGGGDFRVQFDRARSTRLVTELIGAPFPDVPLFMACGYQFTAGGDASNDQTILEDANSDFILRRRNGAGDAEIVSGGSTVVAGDHPGGTFLFTGETGGTSLWEQDGGAFGTGAAAVEQFLVGDRLFLGSDGAGTGDFLDGTLDGINLWMGELSPLTQDFIWQTLNQDGSDFSTDLRAPMNNVLWTDVTGDAALDQFDRLRPQTGFPHRYIRVELPAAPANHRVQVAAAVDGIVLPDSQLGGDLFSYSFAELPGPPFITPALVADAGWSAVADFSLNQEGHYTLVVSRLNGGGVILHFDVQVG